MSAAWLSADRAPEGEPEPMAYVARCEVGHVVVAQADRGADAHGQFVDMLRDVPLGRLTLERTTVAAVREAPLCDGPRPEQLGLAL